MAQYPETSRNRRRAPIAFLDAARRAVPTYRLCPCGVPNKALGQRAPNRRMVPPPFGLRGPPWTPCSRLHSVHSGSHLMAENNTASKSTGMPSSV